MVSRGNFSRVTFLFFACDYPVVSVPFIEKTVSSILNGLGTLVKN